LQRIYKSLEARLSSRWPAEATFVPSVPLARFSSIKPPNMVEKEMEFKFVADIAKFPAIELDLIDEDVGETLFSKTLAKPV
jgi:hypothetical protein